MKEKMLITGANGFLGKRIAQYYENKYTIIAPSHREMDITKEESVDAIFLHNKPDIVIHCAAVSDVGTCDREPERSRKINVMGSGNVAKACRKTGSKCILCSSDQVYFAAGTLNMLAAHSEDELLTPVNQYGKQKLDAEEVCRQINNESVVLRLSWMYDTIALGEKEHGDFMRTLLSGLRHSKKLVYPVYDIRGITNVAEVVSNLEKAVELPGGIYNFGAANDKSTYDTVKELFKMLDFDMEQIYRNEEAFASNPRNISMNQEKINDNGIFFSSTLEGLYITVKSMIRRG